MNKPTIHRTHNRLTRTERQTRQGTFTSDAAVGGWTPHTHVEIRTEPANNEVAAALKLKPGTPVLVRDRLMYANNEPVQLAVSYIPTDLTTGTPIEHENTGPGGIYARLEETGHHLTHFNETIRIGRATQHEATQLALPVDAPVFHITRTAHTHNRAVEINRIVANADRYELHYTLPAEN